MSDGVQLNPIKLIDGENKAEIVGTPIKHLPSLIQMIILS
jgi:hypothetical protein